MGSSLGLSFSICQWGGKQRVHLRWWQWSHMDAGGLLGARTREPLCTPTRPGGPSPSLSPHLSAGKGSERLAWVRPTWPDSPSWEDVDLGLGGWRLVDTWSVPAAGGAFEVSYFILRIQPTPLSRPSAGCFSSQTCFK